MDTIVRYHPALLKMGFAGRLPILNAQERSIVRLSWNAAMPKGCSKLVLVCLAWHASKNERDECFPHVETVARLCGIHPRTASQQLRALALAGLIAVVPRPGRSSLYRLNRTRLAALSSERPAAASQTEPLPELAEQPDQDPVNPAPTPGDSCTPPPVFSAPTPGESCTHKGEEGGMKGERKEDARELVAALAESVASLPPLPEDLKTEAIEPAIEASHDDDVAQVAPMQLADPAPIDAAVLTRINAQRTANGKREPIDVADLVRQAEQAGITPLAAAEWILARPTRSYFRADFTTTPQAAPMDDATKAAARAKADAVQAELLRRSIEAMRAPVLVRQPPARPVGAAVTLRQQAPVSIGGSTGTGWAHKAVARFIAAEFVSHATITSAAAALGLSLSDLKAQRAAQAQGAAA